MNTSAKHQALIDTVVSAARDVVNTSARQEFYNALVQAIYALDAFEERYIAEGDHF